MLIDIAGIYLEWYLVRHDVGRGSGKITITEEVTAILSELRFGKIRFALW